jgi:hypothetical protein
MSDEPTPLLRADATDDDLGTEPFEDDPELYEPQLRVPARDIPDSEDVPATEPGTVEPELRMKARLVPVVVNGVLHGYREEE